MGLRIGSSKVSAIIKSPTKERGRFWFRVVDYDGTILQEAWLNKGDKVKLVAPPTHEGLVFQEWSSPVVITNNEITMPNSDVTIGPTYTTSSGLSEFYITLTAATGLSMTLNIDGTKDWGDGTIDTSKTHTYASVGDYKITCDGSTMDTCTSSSNLFGVAGDYKVTRVHLKSFSSIPSYCFYQCLSLKALTIAKGPTSIGSSIVYSCGRLEALILPSTVTSLAASAITFTYQLHYLVLPLGVTTLGNEALRYLYGLNSICLPESITSVGTSVMQDCYALRGITIPSSITTVPSAFTRKCTNLEYAIIEGNVTLGGYNFYDCCALSSLEVNGSIQGLGGYSFYKCFHLSSVELTGNITSIGSMDFAYTGGIESYKLPGTVTNIAASAFVSNISVMEYDFTSCKAVPTLANVNAFSGINGLCKIKVPASLEAEWKAATNWSTLVSQIVGV